MLKKTDTRRARRRDNPIIIRPLRFLRDRLQIGKTEDGAPVMHPIWREVRRAATLGRGQQVQLLAQRVNLHGTEGL